MTKKKKLDSLWCDRALFMSPYCYRLCVKEKDFKKELRRLRIKKARWPEYLSTVHADATTHFFENTGGKYCAIVNLREGADKESDTSRIVGLLAHEATHIWQQSIGIYGEANPGNEVEAYGIQKITQELYASYVEQTND